MADRWNNTTGGESFRFFSAEQVDQILREGSRRGRAGSHAAIERILKHEQGVGRADLWRRIRRLKHPARQSLFRHAAWNPEDDQILRTRYEAGWTGRQQAVRELLKRHPDWRPHVVWRRAAKLGLTRKSFKRKRKRAGCSWSEDDDRILLNLAGYKHARVIAKILHRTESAVRYRLAVLGKSSRVHKEGYARRALAEDLHFGRKTIQRLIIDGLLEVRDPRITNRSLQDLSRVLPDEHVSGVECNNPEQAVTVGGPSDPSASESEGTGARGWPTRASRAKRFWAEAAKTLGVSLEVVERYILKGILKLCDARITEKSLQRFCRRNGSLINLTLNFCIKRRALGLRMRWISFRRLVDSTQGGSRHLASMPGLSGDVDVAVLFAATRSFGTAEGVHRQAQRKNSATTEAVFIASTFRLLGPIA